MANGCSFDRTMRRDFIPMAVFVVDLFTLRSDRLIAFENGFAGTDDLLPPPLVPSFIDGETKFVFRIVMDE